MGGAMGGALKGRGCVCVGGAASWAGALTGGAAPPSLTRCAGGPFGGMTPVRISGGPLPLGPLGATGGPAAATPAGPGIASSPAGPVIASRPGFTHKRSSMNTPAHAPLEPTCSLF